MADVRAGAAAVLFRHGTILAAAPTVLALLGDQSRQPLCQQDRRYAIAADQICSSDPGRS
jgi:hypothetical protein